MFPVVGNPVFDEAVLINTAGGVAGGDRLDTEVTALGGATVKEFAKAGAVVGALSATDPDGGAQTFSLINDAGGRFAISGATLVVRDGLKLDYEQAKSHAVQIMVTDQGGLSHIETFAIGVADVNPEPVALAQRGRDGHCSLLCGHCTRRRN